MKNGINLDLLKLFFNECKKYHFDDNKKHVPENKNKGNAKILESNEKGELEWIDIPELHAEEDRINKYSYGVKFKYADMSGITRIGNPELHKTCPIQNDYRGCIEQNGVIQYYLSENNWSKKADGTDSRLDGYDGNVSIDTYEDFYMHFEKDSEWCYARMSKYKLDSDWIKVPRTLFHAFRSTRLLSVPTDMGWLSTLPVNSMVSVVNEDEYLKGDPTGYSDTTNKYRSSLNKPTTNISRTDARNYFRLNGYENINFFQYLYIFYWPFVIEYCTFNSQATVNTDLTAEGYRQGGLGDSVSTLSWANWNTLNGYRPIVPNGFMKEFGNKTAFKSFTINITGGSPATHTFTCHSWHGVSNAFGDLWTNLDGSTVIKQLNGSAITKHIYQFMLTPDKYTDAASSNADYVVESPVTTEGWPTQISFGKYGEIVPIKLGGNSSTGLFDYFYTTTNSPACLLVGGSADSGSRAGFGCVPVGDSVGLVNPYVGVRGAIAPKN